MNTSYQSTTHTKADTSHLVWRVAEKAQAESFERFIKQRPGNSTMVANCDTLALGERKLKSSSVATFNKKITAMKNGHLYSGPMELDVDTLPKPAYGTTTRAEGDD